WRKLPAERSARPFPTNHEPRTTNHSSSLATHARPARPARWQLLLLPSLLLRHKTPGQRRNFWQKLLAERPARTFPTNHEPRTKIPSSSSLATHARPAGPARWQLLLLPLWATS